jgi:beta-fructofuranosidase
VKLLYSAEAGVGLQECLVAFMLPDDILVLSANKALAPDHTYLVGRFQNETFTLLASGVSDYGHNAQSGEKRPYNMLHGSQTPTGRTLIWQWQGLIAHPRDVTARGWSSCYSLPREMTLRRDHALAFQPAAELEKLRGDPRQLTADQPAEIPACCELRLTLLPGSTQPIRIEQNGHGFTLAHDTAKQEIVMTIDAAAAHRSYDGPYRAPCATAADGTITLRLYLDRSMVELYTPEGNVISSWVFFHKPETLHLTGLTSTATLWPMNSLTWNQPK